MISKSAKQQYLDRKLANFDWLKKLTRKELLEALSEIDPPYTQVDGIWTHQLAMLSAGIYCPWFLFLADMGSGKSRVILELAKYHKIRGEKNCWLICVINKANIENWLVEIHKYTPDLSYTILDESKSDNLARLNAETDLFLIHYPGLVALCAELRKINKTGKKQRVINQSTLRRLQNKFTGIAMDEMSELGNKTARRSQICYAIAQHAQYRFGATGTPFGRDPTPLRNRYRIIDGGKTLGTNIGLFRAVFSQQRPNYWGGMEYHFKKRMDKDLHRLIGNRSITYMEGECQDLPKRVHIPKIVIMPPYVEAYYRTELKKIRRSEGNFREIEASFIRMRQLASGFIGIVNDETGAKAQIEFPDNPKIDALMEIIKELPSGAKALIYHEFVWTGNRIAQELTKNKLKFERLHGGQKDPRGALRKFQDDPNIPYMVINNYSGSMGLNLQNASYMVFLETPIRPILRQQAERRIRRSGQKSSRVFIYDLIARSSTITSSIDDKILVWLQEGRDLLN